MKKIRVAVSGFGRIGRQFVRQVWDRDEIELVAINDLGSLDNLAYLLTYDTVYGKADFPVEAKDGKLVINGREIDFLSEKDPSKLPWKDLDIDVVVESTGLFTTYESAEPHITAGAKRVVITAPSHGEHDSGDHPLGATILVGVNEDKFNTCQISSNASCTTNAASPLIAVLDETLGIEKALLTTTHAMTNSQPSVDSPNKHNLREGRAASGNIVPTSTGAAVAVTKAYPKLEGLFDGISMRVPLLCGSIVDVTFISSKNTTAEEVNALLTKASQEDRWKGIFSVTNEPLVSSDIIGIPGSIADLDLTRVVGGNFVKVCAWYDNEAGYTATLVAHVIKAGNA